MDRIRESIGASPPRRSAGRGIGTGRRRLLMMGLGGGALTALAACGATSSPPPGDGLTTVDDVPQPHPATTPPSEAQDDWETVTYEGQSFSLPTAFDDPVPHDDWGIYRAAYDLLGNDEGDENDGEDDGEDDGTLQRVLVTGITTDVTTADGVRQTVEMMNSGLIENYSRLNTISWEADGTTAIERVSFY